MRDTAEDLRKLDDVSLQHRAIWTLTYFLVMLGFSCSVLVVALIRAYLIWPETHDFWASALFLVAAGSFVVCLCDPGRDLSRIFEETFRRRNADSA